MSVRVRFAPSPTGELHVGGLRTALFDWLLARHSGGQSILRIEDTDRTRLTPGSMQGIEDAIRWLGLEWDEGPGAGGPVAPYYQSERLGAYAAATERLLAQGDAYRCYCTPERLQALRAEQIRTKQQPGYDRHCRDLTPEQRAEAEAGGASWVVRFKMPREGNTAFVDAIRGEITFENARYDDHILVKSDGFPTYHLSAISDDGEMRITHALRGEEWLPSTPRHLLTFRALGYEPPVYAHVPVIVGKDRKKLSKRHGHTSVRAFREAGYLPEAMLNFLGLIGWSLDDHTTIISREQFIEHFTLERVVKAPALFDIDKLDYLNQHYMQQLPDAEYAGRALPFVKRDLPPEVGERVDEEALCRMAEALKTRVKRLDEIAPLVEFYALVGLPAYERSALFGKKGTGDAALLIAGLEFLRGRLAGLSEWSRAPINEAIGELQASAKEGALKERGVKYGDVMTALRVSLSGRSVSLPNDVMLDLLGRERSLTRIDAVLARLADE